VTLLLEHAIIAIVIIAMMLKKDGCIKSVGIIANFVYRMDCVLIKLKQVKNISLSIFPIFITQINAYTNYKTLKWFKFLMKLPPGKINIKAT